MSKQKAAGAIVVEEQELSSKESILDMVVTNEERDAKYTQQSLAAALLQAINTGDQSLFDSCFEVHDEHLIDSTVKAMIGNNAKIQSLAQQIQKRLSQAGSSIQIWLSALLKYHSAGLVTAQQECFTAIKGQLEGQWNVGRLTRLRGKIDMVLAARRAQEQKEDEEGMQWDDSSSSNNINNVNKNETEDVVEESSQTDSEEQEFEEEEEEEESSFNEDDEEEDEEDDDEDEEEIVEVVKKSSKQAKQPVNSKSQQANKNKNSQASKKLSAKISDEDIDEEDSDYLQL